MLRKSFFFLVWFFSALTFALSLGVSNGYNIGPTLVFISSLSLLYLKVSWKELDEDDKRLFYVFLAFGLSMFFFVYIDGFYIRELDRPSRFILALPVLLLLLQAKGRINWLWYGVIIGAVLAFTLAVYERFYLGYGRAHGSEHPIMFGDTAMMLGLLSFASSTNFLSQKKYVWLVLSIFAGLCGVGASILSASRGGWIALPLIGCFLLWESRYLFSKKIFLSVVGGTVILLIVIVILPQTGVQQRINQTITSISQYGSGENKASSLGMRFEMWKAAFYLFQESPVLGIGEYGEKPEKRRLVSEGLVSPEVIQFSHAHNEYINALAQRGIVGLAFLLAVYLIPMRLFLKKMRQYEHNWRVKSYAMAGAVIPMAYMDFGLSQVMFSHNIGVIMYTFPIVCFWAAVRWAEREERNEA